MSSETTLCAKCGAQNRAEAKLCKVNEKCEAEIAAGDEAVANARVEQVASPAAADQSVVLLSAKWSDALQGGAEAVNRFWDMTAADTSPNRDVGLGLAVMASMKLGGVRPLSERGHPSLQGDVKTRVRLATDALGPYTLVPDLASQFPKEQVAAILVQTMAERFFFENWTVERQEQFCREERIRITNGMYPATAKAELEKALSALEQKAQAFARKTQQNASIGYDTFLEWTYPIAISTFIERLQEASARLGFRHAFPSRELSEEEKNVVTRLMAGIFERRGVDLLRRFAADDFQTARNVFLVVATNTTEDATGLQLIRMVVGPFEAAALVAKCVSNHLIRILLLKERPLEGVNVATQVGVDLLQGWKQNDPYLHRAMFQQIASLVALRHSAETVGPAAQTGSSSQAAAPPKVATTGTLEFSRPAFDQAFAQFRAGQRSFSSAVGHAFGLRADRAADIPSDAQIDAADFNHVLSELGSLVEQSQLDLAREGAVILEQLAPSQLEASCFVGAIAHSTGDIEAAIAAYERVIRVDPKNIYANLGLSRVYFNRMASLDDAQKAMFHAKVAIDSDPDHQHLPVNEARKIYEEWAPRIQALSEPGKP